MLGDFYASLIGSEKIAQALGGDLPQGVTAQVRETAQQQLVFLMNFTDPVQNVELGNRHFTDLLTEAPMGDFVTLNPYDVQIMTRR